MDGLVGLDLGLNPTIEVEHLLYIENPVVIFEGNHVDEDGELAYVYTVGGTIDGHDITMPDHVQRKVRGCLVGGDAIIVHARSRQEADDMAYEGMMTTIKAVFAEQAKGSAGNPNAGLVIDSSRGQ